MLNRKFVFVAIVSAYLVLLAAARNDPMISAENGWLESFQAICLSAGVLFLAAAFYRSGDKFRRLMFAGVTLFYLNFLLREINWKNSELPAWLIFFFGGAGRNWALAAAWLIFCALFLRNRREMTRTIFSWLRSAPGGLLILAGVFYLAGLPFDKKIFDLGVETHELFEELFEAKAALLMFISGVFSFADRGNPAQTPERKIQAESQRNR